MISEIDIYNQQTKNSESMSSSQNDHDDRNASKFVQLWTKIERLEYL